MTQYDRIINYCKAFEYITPFEAFQELGITKLATRIGEMEAKGIARFIHGRVNGKNRYGEPVSYMRYSLMPEWLAKATDKVNDMIKEQEKKDGQA